MIREKEAELEINNQKVGTDRASQKPQISTILAE
jgi:hypothetical protein